MNTLKKTPIMYVRPFILNQTNGAPLIVHHALCSALVVSMQHVQSDTLSKNANVCVCVFVAFEARKHTAAPGTERGRHVDADYICAFYLRMVACACAIQL